MYAAFLKEASHRLDNEELGHLADEMTAIGDMWRNFAYEVAKVIKNRSSSENAFDEISTLLGKIGDCEVAFFKKLARVKI